MWQIPTNFFYGIIFAHLLIFSEQIVIKSKRIKIFEHTVINFELIQDVSMKDDISRACVPKP